MHLERELDAVADATGRKLIGSDGTFSMDGDQCLLDLTIAIAKRHRAWIMIDDAHGMGLHGHHGVGLVDPQRYSTDDVPVLIGTLGKAFGTSGAFVAGDEGLIETLIQHSRNYIYTTAMPSALAAATLASLEIARLIDRFRTGASTLGFLVTPSVSPIQPLMVGDPARALAMSDALEARGFLITAIRQPTVPDGTSRLRITLTAAHEAGDIDHLLEALASVHCCQELV